MNCRRVQKLIPLHVEADLRENTAERVAAHLEWCGRCNWLADEYKESQGRLRSTQPPKFDEATLTNFKQGVLKRIAETAARPSLLASWAQQLSRRQILAFAASLVVVLGIVVLYLYQSRLEGNQEVISKTGSQPPIEEPRPFDAATAPDTEAAPRATSNRPHRSHIRRAVRQPQGHSMIAKQRSERQVVYQSTPSPNAVLPDPTHALSNRGGGSRDMLRIEIQTSDPSIRIIWFAPKETDLHQSKPATD